MNFFLRDFDFLLDFAPNYFLLALETHFKHFNNITHFYNVFTYLQKFFKNVNSFVFLFAYEKNEFKTKTQFLLILYHPNLY